MENIFEMEQQAREAMAGGDLKKSRDIYSRLIELSPQNPMYFTYLGEVYQRLGNSADAQKCRARSAALLAPQPSVPPQAAAHTTESAPATSMTKQIRFCWKCGSPIDEYNNFCGRCGTGINQTPPVTNQSTPPPAGGGQAPPPVHRASSGANGFLYGLTAVLLVGSLALGVFYKVNSDNLRKADDRVTALETNVTGLEGQLAAETASANALQANLTKAQSDLNTSQSQVTSLTADLTAANAAVTATKASLDKSTSDLAAAVSTNTSQAASLKKVQDPRHFDTLAELTAWLANDDTNTNPAYASLSSYSKAFILQVKALRDGYLLPACLDWDANYIYTWNVALVGGTIYSIDPSTDVLTKGPAFSNPPPSHPLPMP
jgi:peptidoglycan hydrolase CwlO-like protein